MAKYNKKGSLIGRPTKEQRFIMDGEILGNGLKHIVRCIVISIGTFSILIFGESVLALIFIIPMLFFHFNPTDIMTNAFSWVVLICGVLQHIINLVYIRHRIEYLRYDLVDTIAVNIVSIITVVTSFLFIYAYDEKMREYFLKDTPLRCFNIVILIIGVILIVYSWKEYIDESDFKLTKEEINKHFSG